MMKEVKQKLTLDRLATYHIKVSGNLGDRWSDWAGGMTVNVERDGEGMLISTLTGNLDPAASQGLLRRLYSSGLPLISVICVESALEAERSKI